MPILQARIGSGGGGGGDATAANQTLQINEAVDTNTTLTEIYDTQVNQGGSQDSVFKDGNQQSVFRDSNGVGPSLIYKTTKNNIGISGLLNQMICISFTNTTAALVAADLSAFLAANDCYVISVTSSQTALSHDLFLTYSI